MKKFSTTTSTIADKYLMPFTMHSIAAKGSKVHLFMTMIKFCGHILFNGQRKAGTKQVAKHLKHGSTR